MENLICMQHAILTFSNEPKLACPARLYPICDRSEALRGYTKDALQGGRLIGQSKRNPQFI